MDLEVLLLMYDQAVARDDLIEVKLKSVLADRVEYHRLMKIRGVGPVIAATILPESTAIERFNKARQYAAFTSLVPRVRSSAGKAHIGHITRTGPPLLRWVLCQAAPIGSRSTQQTDV